MSVQVAQKQNSGQALIETKQIESDKKPQQSGGYTPAPIMFGFDQTIEYGGKTFNIAELATEDVQRQYGEMLGPSEDEVKAKFNQIMSATTQQEISAAGVDMKIGDTFITPNYLDSIRNEPAKQAELFGDVSEQKLQDLAESLEHDGLRQPVDILPNGVFVDGHQRLGAAKRIGWRHIEVNIFHDLAGAGEEAVEERMIKSNEI